MAAREHRVRRLPPATDERGAEDPAPAPDEGRRAGALHAQGLPRPAPVLDRGPRHDRADARRADPAVGGQRRQGGRDRDGPPRAPERARAQPRPPLRHDLRRVRGRLDARGGDDDPAGRHGRREVSPRHPGLLRAARRREHPGEPRVQPEPPRVRLAGRRGRDARGADRASGTPRPPGHRRGGADRDPRRRLLPRPGRRGGDAQPAGARRLQGRRHGAPDHEQPDRLHDRPRRRALDALGIGSGKGLRRADHPRQRRRRARLHQRRATRVRLPQGVRPRRADRPDRLPALRTQRVRRAGLHPAGDVRDDQGEETRLGAVGRAARGRRRRHTGGRRQAGAGRVGRSDASAPAPEGEDRGRGRARWRQRKHRRVPARPLAEPRGEHRGARRLGCASWARSC